MGKVKNQSDRVRLAFKLFDSEGVALVNTLKLGKKGLEEAATQAGKLGLIVNRKMAAAVERANDALFELKSVGIGIFRQLTVRAAPAIETVTTALTEMFAGENRIDRFVEAITQAFVKGMGVVLDAIHSVRVGFAAMKADFLGAVVDAKNSTLGSQILGDLTRKDRLRALDARGAAYRLRTQEKPSVGFSRFANNALNFQTGPTAEQLFGGGKKSTAAFDALTEAAKGATGFLGNLLKTPGQIGQGIASNPLNQLQAGIFKTLFSNFDATKLAVAGGKSGAETRRPNLRALEAGTAEAFAASRKNLNPGKSVDERTAKANEEQLAVQKQMNDAVQKMANSAVLTSFAIQ